MAERDWADELADGCWDDLILYAKGGASETTQKRRLAAFLRKAHAAGVSEGAAAERQRCAGVCDSLASQWESGEQGRLYLQGMIGAVTVCRDAILRDPGAGPAETPTPHGPPVTADPGRRLYEGGHVQPDPNPPVCGTCVLWHQPQGCDFGFCKVARMVTNRGPDCPGLGTLKITTAAHTCDVGAWRAKGE